MVGKGGVLNFP